MFNTIKFYIINHVFVLGNLFPCCLQHLRNLLTKPSGYLLCKCTTKLKKLKTEVKQIKPSKVLKCTSVAVHNDGGTWVLQSSELFCDKSFNRVALR